MLGERDFTLSQSYYEKLRSGVKKKLETGEIKLDDSNNTQIKDLKKITELIEIYYFRLQTEIAKPDFDANELISSGDSNKYKHWSIIDNSSEMIIKLLQIKSKTQKPKE